jgi:hypothetical protein
MQADKDLLRILKENKGGHIHYWDNGDWSIYGVRDWADYTTAVQEYETSLSLEEPEWPEPLYEGSDRDGAGYESPLVVALAELAGISVDSI